MGNPEILGLHTFEQNDEVLTHKQQKTILKEVIEVLDKANRWETRNGVDGTQRKTFGCKLDKNYEIIGREEIPPDLQDLGDRVARFFEEKKFPYSHTHIGKISFDQVYVQRYVPGTSSETMGFHFDSFSQFDELICGVTLCGNGNFLLKKTITSDFVEKAEEVMSEAKTLSIAQCPLSFYALTGMSRYDLMHAVVAEGTSERISVTFRTV